MLTQQINVAVIGSGYWGPKLIRNFHELPETTVTMVADLNPERLEQIGSTFPAIHLTSDYHDVLANTNVDAVVVATPVSTHHTIARDALLSGKHVLVEKPLTNDVQQAEELISIARTMNLRLMVGHVFEYSPAVLKLKELVQSGELGEIYYIDLVRATLGLFQRDINVIWDLAPHDFSILRFVLGSDPESVSAHGAAYVQSGIHDVAYIQAKFANTVQAHIRVSWLEPQKQRKITVVGSRKMAVYDDSEPIEKIRIYDLGVEWADTDRLGSGQLRYRYGDIVSPRISAVEPLQQECQHFSRAIRDGIDPQSSGEVGLRIVQTLAAADRSLRVGGEQVEIDQPALVL